MSVNACPVILGNFLPFPIPFVFFTCLLITFQVWDSSLVFFPTGLAVYSSDSDEEGDKEERRRKRRRSGDDADGSTSGDSDDDEKLQERILRKKQLFDLKMKQMEEEQRGHFNA